MCPVTCEIISTELVLRVLSILHQVVSPGGYDVPVRLYVGSIAIELAEHGSQRQHIASLLERHVAAIHLTVCDGIGSQVMCCERFGPASALAVVEDTGHHGLL